MTITICNWHAGNQDRFFFVWLCWISYYKTCILLDHDHSYTGEQHSQKWNLIKVWKYYIGNQLTDDEKQRSTTYYANTKRLSMRNPTEARKWTEMPMPWRGGGGGGGGYSVHNLHVVPSVLVNMYYYFADIVTKSRWMHY